MSTIRELTPDDLPAVAGLWAREFRTRPEDQPEAFLALRERHPELILVAELGGRVVGTAFATWDGRQATIHRLVVEEGSRRQGIGRALVRELLDRLDRLGAREVALHAGDDIAVDLFERLGFETIPATYMKIHLW